MPTIPKKFTTVLAVIALALAQFAGLPGGWLCACDGEPVMVTEQWCSGGECHEVHEADDHGDDPVEHREVREALETIAAAPLHFTPPMLLEYTPPVPAELGVKLAQACADNEGARLPYWEDPGGCGGGLSYARRTAVLLI